ncbi:MAG TPA: hypothetical protein VJ861_12980 [Treponemataceae bacterium]|nr:hypothetical protein [Treponemataceae bacterium]
MKESRLLFVFASCFLILSFPVLANPASLGAGESDMRFELQEFDKKALSADALGNWQTVIHSTLFILARTTEIYRGPLRILVPDQKEIVVSLYNDGTFVISSGLLDYIDSCLFNDEAISIRRMQTIDYEREVMLAQFLVPEIAALALGQNLNAPRLSQQVLEADRFAPIILSLAGYDPKLYAIWLKNLSSLYSKGTETEAFKSWLQSKPSPAIRIESISNSLINIKNISSEYSLILASMKTGTALKDASDLLTNLTEIYPKSTYLFRLSALVNHKLWLESVPETTLMLKPMLPFADEIDLSRAKFIKLLSQTPQKHPGQYYMEDQDSIPGNIQYFMKASENYKKTLTYMDDPLIASAQAQLLIWSGNTSVRKSAMRIAEESAGLENGSESFLARSNFANLLYLTGSDYLRCQYILEDLIAETKTIHTETNRFVSSGFPGDSRDMLLNLILILRSLTDIKKAEEILPIFKTQTVEKKGTSSFRNVRIGDNQDILTEAWGRPAEIVYNYFTETWFFPSLKTSVLLTLEKTSTKPVISLIRIENGSPVSPGKDIRTGDSFDDFIKAFGNHVYKTGDKYVFLIDENRLSVCNLYGTIRNMTAGL